MTKRKPAFMQVTRKCNNSCVFCSNPQFDKDYSFEEAVERIRELHSQGVNEISFTGGEPTLVEFLPELIRFAVDMGISTRIISNGANLSDRALVRKLKAAGLGGINISVHTHKKEDSIKLGAAEGNFEKTLAGIGNAVEAGFHVVINSTINSVNCSYLSEFIAFYMNRYPSISHFVFNNLDPGTADGNMQSRAGRNPWIVARLVDMELELYKTAMLLRKNKRTFRIERVPLCYMQGFEEFSTETRKIVKDEQYICSFVEKDKENEVRIVEPGRWKTIAPCCEVCTLYQICAAVQREYADLHGLNELYPVFTDPKKIRKKILD
jgi:MoaA/NifB/PqqE/SkfB family radical SAM enzyme